MVHTKQTQKDLTLGSAGDGTTWIRKLLIDRLLFAPPFLLLFLFGVNVLEVIA